MAKKPAVTDEQQEKPKGPSLVIQIAVLLVLTLVAAGAGIFAVKLFVPGPAPAEAAADHAAPGKAKEKKEEHGSSEDAAAADLKRGVAALPPITTNLASPANTWVRIELAAVFEAEPDLAMADAVNQDILAFLRTVKMHQVEGASGFLHLKEDMNERARIRSGGKVTHLLIKTLLFE